MTVRQSADEIEQEAAAWILRIDREGNTPALKHALEQWLEGDSRRQGALLVVEATWQWLDIAGRDRGEGTRPQDQNAANDPNVNDEARSGRPITRRTVLVGAGAAAAACAIGYLGYPRQGETFETRRGEIRRIALSDRSVATINTVSRLNVSFAARARSISLEEGEAWFQVAHDPTRPFTVSAGQVRVQAIGTAFSVRRLGSGTQILVTEGVVRTWKVGAEHLAVRVSAGDRAFVGNEAMAAQLFRETPAIERALAWRTGDINLGGESLGHAVAEFNRYNSTKLVIADPTVAGRPLYGIFRLDDPDGFAHTVAAGLKVPLHADGTAALIIGDVRK